MAFISFGKWKKKNIFIIISIILSYSIFQSEYYSGFYYDCKDKNSPHLFSLYLSFSFLGCILLGGIFFFKFEYNIKKTTSNTNNINTNNNNTRNNNTNISINNTNISINNTNNSFNNSNSSFNYSNTNISINDKINESIKGNSNKKNLETPLLYNEEHDEIFIPMRYFILSSFLEIISNFSFYSLTFDFIDIESKMLFDGFEIIFIKIIDKFIFKHQLYKHQIISMIILIVILVLGINIRERYLKKLLGDDIIINEQIQEYIKQTFKNKNESNIKFFYPIFIILGCLTSSFNVCFDNWLMIKKLCGPFKLLFFKGIFGIIPTFSIQIFLYFYLGEWGKTKQENIDILNIFKRVSFPFSSFNSILNIIFIIIFFIFVGMYQVSIISTNNKFQPEFVGFVLIISSGLSIISNELVNIFISGNDYKNKFLICLIPLGFFIIELIISLIICELIIIKICNCDKNIVSNIDKRGTLEANYSFKKYIEDAFKDEKIGIEDISNDSQDNSNSNL